MITFHFQDVISLCRLEIEMSRGYTYGRDGSFKSEINRHVLICNFFYCKACRRLPGEGESSDPLTCCAAYLIEPLTLPAVSFLSRRKGTGCRGRLDCGNLASSWMGEVSRKREARLSLLQVSACLLSHC